MKNLYLTLILSLFVSFAFAQNPQGLTYQAVARGANGAVIANQQITVRISVLTDSATGPVQYKELHQTTTNAFGLFTLTIGQPAGVVSGSFTGITWASGTKYISVEIDPAGGNNFVNMGVSQLLSVPYAMYAGRAKVDVSAFQPTGCQDLANVTATMQKIGDMGTLVKKDANTYIELCLQTMLYVGAFGTSNNVVFELRIDGQPTTIGNATFLVRQANIYLGASITGVFSGLAAGSHTVSLWAKGGSGTASNAYWDAGCFNSAGTNNVLVKEY